MTIQDRNLAAGEGALRARILTECRRASNGLDPDDVYAYILRLQARIDFLEGANATILDTTLRQAAEIRRQALEAAERAWTDIVQAAEQEATRRHEQATHDAQLLFGEACEALQLIHDRLRARQVAHRPTAMPAIDQEFFEHGPVAARTPSSHQVRQGVSDAVPHPLTTHQDQTSELACIGETEPPFRVPTWIED